VRLQDDWIPQLGLLSLLFARSPPIRLSATCRLLHQTWFIHALQGAGPMGAGDALMGLLYGCRTTGPYC
jgi:hypothetical protein